MSENTAACKRCGGKRVVPDNIGPHSYPEKRPCPDCTNGTWADTNPIRHLVSLQTGSGRPVAALDVTKLVVGMNDEQRDRAKDILLEALHEVFSAPTNVGEEKPVAWMRRYVFEKRGEGTRGNRPAGWKFHDVTKMKVCDDDVPLYAAPISANIPADVERDVLQRIIDSGIVEWPDGDSERLSHIIGVVRKALTTTPTVPAIPVDRDVDAAMRGALMGSTELVEDFGSAASPAYTPRPVEGEVERVARAIAAAANGDDPTGDGWEEWEPEATAAIAALNTPAGVVEEKQR